VKNHTVWWKWRSRGEAGGATVLGWGPDGEVGGGGEGGWVGGVWVVFGVGGVCGVFLGVEESHRLGQGKARAGRKGRERKKKRGSGGR